MAKLKIEEVKELEMELKELNVELEFEELMLEKLRLGCKLNSK